MSTLSENATIAAVVGAILAALAGYWIYWLGNRRARANAQAQEAKALARAIRALESEIEWSLGKICAALESAYFDSLGEVESITGGIQSLLVENPAISMPTLAPDYRGSFDNFHHTPELSPGLQRMLREYYSQLAEVYPRRTAQRVQVDLEEAFSEITILELLLDHGNELVFQLQWAALTIEDPKKIQEHIKAGVQKFTGSYQGTWAVPWLKPYGTRRSRLGEWRAKYQAARRTYNETGRVYPTRTDIPRREL